MGARHSTDSKKENQPETIEISHPRYQRVKVQKRNEEEEYLQISVPVVNET